MNAKRIFAASFIAFAATAALADDITIDHTPFVPTLTRAQVEAQVAQARAHGESLDRGDAYQANRELPSKSTLSRATVRAETIAAMARGELAHAGELMYRRDM